MRIGIDCDGVLRDLIPDIVGLIKEKHPEKLHHQIHRWVVFARRPCDDGTNALFTMPG